MLFRQIEPEPSREHFRRPEERLFTADQRGSTMVLFGGLTLKHEQLIKACLESLGHRCEYLPVPDVRSLQIGKEYSNNGQCNPTYFTVGNLIKYLQQLRDSGLSTEQILRDYIFVTAGSCGPCRFGMYEAEYRHALGNAGFEGFRIIIFQQTQGYSNDEVEAGLRMDFDFFLSLIYSVLLGDLLNEVGCQIRPYEMEKGATDSALDQCAEILYHAIRQRRLWSLKESRLGILKRIPFFGELIESTGKFTQLMLSRHIIEALEECRQILQRVEVDRTRVTPVVQITGEFWAQITEGDGNFNMFRFLESEGAEIRVNSVSTWLLYVFWGVKAGYRDRFGLKGNRNPLRHFYRLARINVAEWVFLKEYVRFCKALGGTAKSPIPLQELERLGYPYYHSRTQGGEGYLEVAKSIHAISNNECHMVLSLKPFGCMPSTQSDGVMALVTAHYPDMIFLPIETAGDGEINAHSRVQMALGEARRKARDEFDGALQACGYSLKEISEYIARHPSLQSALYKIPRHGEYAGTAANFVTHVASLMESSP